MRVVDLLKCDSCRKASYCGTVQAFRDLDALAHCFSLHIRGALERLAIMAECIHREPFEAIPEHEGEEKDEDD